MAERQRFERSHEHGGFARIMVGLATERAEHKTIMIDVSRRTPCVRVSLRKYLKTHRTASSLWVKKGRARQIGRTKDEHQIARRCRRSIGFLMPARSGQRLHRRGGAAG